MTHTPNPLDTSRKDSMNLIIVEGHSDDIITVRDKDNGDDEHGAYNGAKFLRFSDGTVLKVQYSPADYRGKWKVELITLAEGTEYRRTSAKDDEDEYSDVVELEAVGLKLAHCGRSQKVTKEELVEALDEVEWVDLKVATLEKIVALVKGDN